MRWILVAIVVVCLPRLAHSQDQGAVQPNITQPNTLQPIVEAIIRRNCQSCHNANGSAPFALETPHQLQSHAAEIGEAIASGKMPPWRPVNSAGRFLNDFSLTPLEHDRLIAWADILSVQPVAASAMEVSLPTPAKWRFGEPKAMERAKATSATPNEQGYWTATIDLNNRTYLRVRAMEVRTSAGAPMQQAWVILDQPAALSTPETSFAKQPRPIVSFLESTTHWLPWTRRPGESRPLKERTARFLITRDLQPIGLFSADSPAMMLPHDTAWVFPPDSKLHVGWRSALQMRLSLEGQELEIGIHLVPKETETNLVPRMVVLRGKHRDGISGRVTRDEFVAPVPLSIEAVAVNGSFRTRDTHVDVIRRDGRITSLLWIDRYDPRWETTYKLTRSERLPQGGRLDFSALESASSQASQRPVPFASGAETFAEAFDQSFACVLVTPVAAADQATLDRVLWGRQLQSSANDRDVD
jgi:hypothetical protein